MNAAFKKLIAWQKANELALLIYKITATFPKSEVFGITSQLRRAGLSVPTNIVEGHARNNKKEFQGVCLIRESTGNIIWKLYQSQKCFFT